MTKTTGTLIAAVAALALSGAAYAQNNTLATPSVVSPAAATSGYGTPGTTNSDSGVSTASPNGSVANGMSNSSTVSAPAYGTNNTLATPGVASPAGQ